MTTSARHLHESRRSLVGPRVRPSFLEFRTHLERLFGSRDLDRLSAFAHRRWPSPPSA